MLLSISMGKLLFLLFINLEFSMSPTRKSNITEIFLVYIMIFVRITLHSVLTHLEDAGLHRVLYLTGAQQCRRYFVGPILELFISFSFLQPEGNVMHPIHLIQKLIQTKTVLQSPIHARCTGALNYKIKPPAHESIKLKYKTQ